MSLKDLKARMPDYAKDTELNLGNIMDADGIDGLNLKQGYMIALASACATRQPEVMHSIHEEVKPYLDKAEIKAAKAAATIMSMNNTYYRFINWVSDKEYASFPAGLRMNVIGDPGVDQVDFELMCLAVSAINGCPKCIEAHVGDATKLGTSKLGIQSAVRIASVMAAVAQALTIKDNICDSGGLCAKAA